MDDKIQKLELHLARLPTIKKGLAPPHIQSLYNNQYQLKQDARFQWLWKLVQLTMAPDCTIMTKEIMLKKASDASIKPDIAKPIVDTIIKYTTQLRNIRQIIRGDPSELDKLLSCTTERTILVEAYMKYKIGLYEFLDNSIQDMLEFLHEEQRMAIDMEENAHAVRSTIQSMITHHKTSSTEDSHTSGVYSTPRYVSGNSSPKTQLLHGNNGSMKKSNSGSSLYIPTEKQCTNQDKIDVNSLVLVNSKSSPRLMHDLTRVPKRKSLIETLSEKFSKNAK